MTADQRVRVEQLLTKRLSRVPLQHLLGTAAFRYVEVNVGRGVFIPRPETELVTEAGIRELGLKDADDRVAVDLCSGSGAIALSLGLESEGSRVYAVELSDEAVEWTRRNVADHEAALEAKGSKVEVLHEDATTVAEPGHGLGRMAGKVAVVVSNPPYIPDMMIPREPEVRDHEPKMALYGGEDGLDIVRGVVRAAAILLRPGGLLVIEHADIQGLAAGEHGVPGVVSAFTSDAELSTMINIPSGRKVFTSVADRIDLNGLPRFTLARRVQD
jgi:release factor glutamine methyltransferase